MSVERQFETSETTVGGIAEDMFMNLVSSRVMEPECEWHTFRCDFDIDGKAYTMTIAVPEQAVERAE